MARVRITHVESFKVFAPGARPNFAWREGLRGGPADGLVAVLRLHTDEGIAGVAVAQNRCQRRRPRGLGRASASRRACRDRSARA